MESVPIWRTGERNFEIELSENTFLTETIKIEFLKDNNKNFEKKNKKTLIYFCDKVM